jgi:hypothetical protein
MNSSDLIPNEHDLADPASDEVQFALVIARMIDPMKNSPDDMRQVVYDFARYKLQEQFTCADARRLGIRGRRSKPPFAASRNSRGSRLAFHRRGSIVNPPSGAFPSRNGSRRRRPDAHSV